MNGKELQKLRSDKGLSQKQLSDATGIPLGTIGRLESSGDDIKKVSTSSILERFFKSEADGGLSVPGKGYGSPIVNQSKGAPYYDIDFKGGFDVVFNDHTIQPAFYIDFPPFNDADGWINVSGKSMGPLIAHGDIVALKRVDGWKEFLLEGEIYAIVTNNGFRTIKILGKGPDKDHYMLIPYNKGEEYNPQPIPKHIIIHVFRVMGAMKKFF